MRDWEAEYRELWRGLVAGYIVGWIPLVLAGVGMAISAFSKWRAGKAAKEQGEAQKRAAESQAQLLDFNANVAELQAKDAVERGAEEESRFRSSVRGMIGAQRAGIAAGNVDVGFGSAVDVQADASHLGELDALTIRTNAAREAWGFKVEAMDTRKRAEITRKEGVMLEKAGRTAQSSHRIDAIGGLATGGLNLLAQKYGFGGEK
jgi:hypothetical protein